MYNRLSRFYIKYFDNILVNLLKGLRRRYILYICIGSGDIITGRDIGWLGGRVSDRWPGWGADPLIGEEGGGPRGL